MNSVKARSCQIYLVKYSVVKYLSLLLCLLFFQYERHMEKERAAEATKTIDAEWKELQMLVSALKVRRCLAYCGFLFNTSSLFIMYFILCLQLSSDDIGLSVL